MILCSLYSIIKNHNITIRMFEGKSQKGLFTFYWEQSQNQASCQTTMHPSIQNSHTNTPKQKCIEEIQTIEKCKKSKALYSSNSLGQLLLLNRSKQSRSLLKPNYVNLKPKIDDKSTNKFFMIKKRKENKQIDRAQLAKSERLSFVHKDILDDSILIEQKNIKFRPINIELPQNNKENIFKLNQFNPMKKLTKMATQSLSKKQIRLQKIHQLSNINIQIQEKYVKLPKIDCKPSIKKFKSPKLQFCIQKFMLERLLISPCNSVINIGQVSVKDERLSWRLRKQKFLQQLGRSSLHN